MRLLFACALVALTTCHAPGRVASPSPANGFSAQEAILIALADSIFAAARDRDAARFASYFSDRHDFVYLINTRRVGSRRELNDAFLVMLSHQRTFEPRWISRHVQVLSEATGVMTGEFETTAQQQDGTFWEARGVVTFVAARESSGWRVVNWHTTERTN